MGKFVLAFDVLESVVFDDEVGSKHRGSEFTVVGAMADELEEEHGVRLFWYVRGVIGDGKKREAIYCTKKIVAFEGEGELDCTTEAGRCDFIEFRHCDRCCRCR